MATENIKKRTGVKIADVSRILRERRMLAEQKKQQQQAVVRPPVSTPQTPRTAKLETKPILPLKKTDIADKKAKSLFKFLDDSGIEQPDKLLYFVRWCALPRQLRKPETQEKLSEKIGIHKDTFANWKRRSGFWNEVALYRKSYGRSHVSDVVQALIRNAKTTGDPRAVKLVLQYFEDWSEKVRTEDETPDKELDPELKEQIRHAIHNIGLATIKEGYEKDEDDTLSTDENE